MRPKTKDKLQLVVEPGDYFKSLVSQALVRQKLTTSPHVEFYIVNLLISFLRTEVKETELAGCPTETTLVDLLNSALNSPDLSSQQKGFRKLGDISLYTAGFFSESLHRKTVDIDYYIQMGSNAYGQLAALIQDSDFQKLYGDLSDRFHQFVDILAEVKDETQVRDKTPQNILQLYDLWVRTRSERVALRLKELGVIPNTETKKKRH